jgi:large subunit ribosomal protein L9
MRVLLREDVPGVGRRGDVVEVEKGFARNYLLPSGRGLVATDRTLRQAEAMRRARDLRELKAREAAEMLAQRLAGRAVLVRAKAGRTGRLFGSVTSDDIRRALHEQLGVELDRRRIELAEPIRSLGTHEVTVHLHPELNARLTVEVQPEEG